MDFLLGIAIGILITLAVRWSARIERRNAEAEDNRAMQRCKEAEERSLQQSVARVKEQWVDVRKPELETQDAVMVEDETQIPNPFEETFDAFDEWYLEEFSRIG